jgi:hypothetical protein
MMFPYDIEFVVYERHKDLLRQAERMHLIKFLEHGQVAPRNLWLNAIRALGQQMVAWGTKLQNFSSPVAAAKPECC